MTVQPLTMSEVVDPDEVQKARIRRKRSERNLAWLRAHAGEVYTRHRGRHICIAGEEIFVGQTAAEALRMARSAHPEDDGFYLRFIPFEKVPRVYGHRG